MPDAKADALRHVYFIEAVGQGRVKIGCAGDPAKRLATMQVGNAAPLKLLGSVQSEDAERTERDFHAHYAHLRVRGEWFRLTRPMRRWIADLTLDGRGSPLVYAYETSPTAEVTIHGRPGESVAKFAARVWKVCHALHPEIYISDDAPGLQAPHLAS